MSHEHDGEISSELSGFYRLKIPQRRARLAAVAGLSEQELADLSHRGGLSDEQANSMVENAVGTLGLPLGMCMNLRIDGVDRLVAMAIEEPSVVAAASYAAKLFRTGGGIRSEISPPHMIGQVQLLDVADPDAAEQAILAAREELLALADTCDPSLIAAGGGARDLLVRHLPPTDDNDPVGPMMAVHLIVDVQDAMGANAVNSMCETLAPRIGELSGGRVGLRILSNLADRRTVTVRGSIPFAMLEGKGVSSGEPLAQRIVEASVFAERDPYRAATHNKGIMNGIDAVLLAFGQDWRAVEAGAHAFAARSGHYGALARWRVSGGRLRGTLELPMAVGTIGGVARVHPTVQIAQQIAGVTTAAELAACATAVGLAQNLGALRALSAEGIQRGHMRLHARNVAVEAGAEGSLIQEVASFIADHGTIDVPAAKQAIERMEAQRRAASTIPEIYMSDTMQPMLARFEQLRERHWPAIARHIDEVVEHNTPKSSSLLTMCHYHMETGGKRLRALLPLLVAQTLGGEADKLTAFGAACEMVHNATLVHDDLIDGDLVRRGRKTVWSRFGVPQAVNLGDAMLFYAMLLVQRIDAPAERRNQVLTRLLAEALKVIDGQEREFTMRSVEQPALDDYFKTVEGKTSGMFSLPMAGAAVLCDSPPAVVAGLEEAARHMGVLFQIQDDTLDLYGDKGRDALGSDIGEGKRSALVVHALQVADDRDRSWLLQVLDKDRTSTSPKDVVDVLALFERTDTLAFVLSEMKRRRELALSVKSLAGQPTLQEGLAAMCDLFLRPIQPLFDQP